MNQLYQKEDIEVSGQKVVMEMYYYSYMSNMLERVV
jgi:hypothetical protein